MDSSPLKVQTSSLDHHQLSLPEFKYDQRVSGLIGDVSFKYESLRKRKDSSGGMEDFRNFCKKNLFDLMDSMDFQEEEEEHNISKKLKPEESDTFKEIVGSSFGRSVPINQVHKEVSGSDFFDEEDEEEARQLELVLSQLDMDPYMISQSGKSDVPTTYERRNGGHLKCSRMIVLSVNEHFYEIDDSHLKFREKVS